MSMRYFILGGGIAGLSAARAIREKDPSGLIVLLTDEPALPYSRPMLTKGLLTTQSAADLAVEPARWYDAPGRDIQVLTNRQVKAIDPALKTVTLADGLVFSWDKLIYALGARCFIPPIAGSNPRNVVAIRHFSDVERVRELAVSAKTAVVIGGGVLGLEAASALCEGGLKVTVLENGDQLMKRQIDQEAADALVQAMERKGATIVHNAQSAAIDDAGVHLADGRVIPADLVLISAGVRANTAIAEAAGLTVVRKVVVDDHMRTNLPDIYAAGDCAVCGVSYALWTEAADMGRVAGENAAGGDAAYHVVPRPLIFHGFGTELFAFGDCGKEPGKTYEVSRMPGARYYAVGEKLVGAILVGDISRMAEVEAAILDVMNE